MSAFEAIQQPLGRTVVLRQGDDLGFGREAMREIQDVLDRGGAKRVDRLCIVADDGDTGAIGLQAYRISACSLLVSWYSSTST